LRYKYLLVAAFLFFGLKSESQSKVQFTSTDYQNFYLLNVSDRVKLNGKYLTGIYQIAWKMIKSPLTWSEKDWRIAAGIGTGTIALVAFDEVITNWVADAGGDVSNTTSDIFEPLGKAEAFMPWSPMIVLYGYGAIAGDYRAKKAGLLAIESYLITGFFTLGLKYAINRERPFSETGQSFPSGHTSSIFAVVTVLATEYKDKKWLPPVLYSIAGLTSLSRINDLEHWTSDVFFGFALGFFIGKAVSKIHEHIPAERLSIGPVYNYGTIGIGINYRF